MTDTTTADEPLPSTAPAAEMAARAQEIHERGIAQIEQAQAEQSDADAERAAELERLAAERAQAEARHREHSSGAARDRSTGEHNVRRADWLGGMASKQEEAERDAATVASLEAERAALLKQVAGLSERLAEGEEERRQLDGKYEAALDAEDRGSITDLSAQIGTAEAMAGRREAERAKAQDRLSVIGDGEGPGLLREARDRLSAARAIVQRGLRDVWPDSEEAREHHRQEEIRGIIAGNLERDAEERRAAQQPQHQLVARPFGH